MLLMYPLGAVGVGPRHAAQHAIQPWNRMMVPSQGLPIEIHHQVQPMDRGSKTSKDAVLVCSCSLAAAISVCAPRR